MWKSRPMRRSSSRKANTALFEKQKKLNADWLAITHELKADDSAAEIQAVNKALDWAQAAGVNIAAYKAERSTMAGDFEVIGFHLTGTGSTPAMARLLYSFETAPIPVRVDQMTLTPVKEGTDNLKIELDLSTLCSKPPARYPRKIDPHRLGKDLTGAAMDRINRSLNCREDRATQECDPSATAGCYTARNPAAIAARFLLLVPRAMRQWLGTRRPPPVLVARKAINSTTQPVAKRPSSLFGLDSSVWTQRPCRGGTRDPAPPPTGGRRAGQCFAATG